MRERVRTIHQSRKFRWYASHLLRYAIVSSPRTYYLYLIIPHAKYLSFLKVKVSRKLKVFYFFLPDLHLENSHTFHRRIIRQDPVQLRQVNWKIISQIDWTRFLASPRSGRLRCLSGCLGPASEQTRHCTSLLYSMFCSLCRISLIVNCVKKQPKVT